MLEAIAHLRQLTQLNIQSQWHYCRENLAISQVQQPESWQSLAADWPIAKLNEKGHIAWPANREVIWLTQTFIIPADLQGYPLAGFSLRLALLWWAEDGQIFLNGHRVGQGDLFDCNMRILLSSAVVPGEKITLALRFVSPGHDPGALVRSHLIYEPTAPGQLDPGFVADELTILWNNLNTYASDDPKILETFHRQINSIDWSVVQQRETFNESLAFIRENARSLLSQLPNLPQKISLLGHAHLDLAWLWPIHETWDAAQRTFESVLNLMSDFPELTFCHSTAALYEWIEINRPDLFSAIQEQVKAGRWEIVAGLWVEPELNIISGEAIARQLLYGQRYCLEKFGQVAPVAWLPDSFGFCWQLPQLFKQADIEYFVTQKLRWNDTNQFPYGVFWWESPDGSRIFSLMSAAIGKDINPVEMADYSREWQQQTGINESLWLPGVGDHGGGPTRDMLEIARKWQASPVLPHLEFTTAEDYLQQLDKSSIPIWQDELYLEYHRGCYTSYANQKQWNRRCEDLLYQAELFSSLATMISNLAYPQAEIEAAWKQVLFNQFHDILPGSAIPEVYVDANESWQAAQQVATEILDNALRAIAHQISLPSPPTPEAKPIIIFNSLNWSRSEVVTVTLPNGVMPENEWQIYTQAGEQVRSQLNENRLLFYAEDIPSIGYRLFWLVANVNPKDDALPLATKEYTQVLRSPLTPLKKGGTGVTVPLKKGGTGVTVPFKEEETGVTVPLKEVKVPLFKGDLGGSDRDFGSQSNIRIPSEYLLENQILRVIVDPDTGNLSSIFDKINQREILNGAGNQLQAFQDKGQYWDAWNIDPNYAQHPLTPPTLKEIQWLEHGPIQWRLRVVRQIGRSLFIQDYILQTNSPLLKISTTVDWQEPHVMVKAAFPLKIEAETATYEMPCGAIQRTAKPQTPEEKAKWEVPALRWADLSENSKKNSNNLSYGVSVLNDCKYGYDAQPNQLRLTLLRGSTWPDPNADFYQHQFNYGIYPHFGSWQSAQTVRRGYEFNLPLSVLLFENSERVRSQKSVQTLPANGSFLDLSAENLILMAFKPTEDKSETQQWILRCYECHGQASEMNVKSDLGLTLDESVNLLEQPIGTANGQISPWKVTSFRVLLP